MKPKVENQKSELNDIWVLAQHRKGSIEEATFGLIGEARRFQARVTAVVMGSNLDGELKILGHFGADRVLYVKDERLDRYQGELFSKALAESIRRDPPAFVFFAQSAESMDLAPRVAALLDAGLVTRAMDLKMHAQGRVTAVRPIANGYLFEELELRSHRPFLVSFLPSVLSAEDPDQQREAEVLMVSPQVEYGDPRAVLKELVQPDSEVLDLEEADIIISGGRGVGRGEAFQIIDDLAKALGGSVSGTRPVIDWETLPYERQIGQTGKTVTPRLLVACGISGANEYTAGMEKSHLVIAINTDPRARIFRFADLGVVGDVHEILPLLIKKLNDFQ
jgi:electron transfer flavoprotein alpha subunit